LTKDAATGKVSNGTSRVAKCLRNDRLAVVWDMDGVIVDTGEYHFRAWKKACKEKGIAFDEQDFKRTFGMRNPEILRYLLEERTRAPGKSLRPPTPRAPHTGLDSQEDLMNSLKAEVSENKERYYREFVTGNVVPLPGAVELLKSLREAGFRQALATSSPTQNVDLVMNSLGIRQFFQAVVSEKDVKAGKPDPEIFLTAAARIKIEAACSLVIEDSVAGVAAAKQAGMSCVAVSNTHDPERLREADLVVNSLIRLNVESIKAILQAKS